jgi:DNA primase
MIFDFNELNQLFPAEEWLTEQYGCEFYASRSGWLNSSCPFDDHNDSNPSFGICTEKGIFKCFGCGREGDFIHLICQLLTVPFLQSVNIIAAAAGIDLGNYDSFEFKNQKFKKALIEEDNTKNKEKRIIQQCTIKIKNIMKNDFQKAEEMYKRMDNFIENNKINLIKEMIDGTT